MRLVLALLACAAAAYAQPAFTGAAAIDEQINQAIDKQLIPGAVLLIGHNDAVVYRKAYGSRALVPAREAMTEDTIFDAASLTKIVATTSSLMRLVEQGKLRLNDRVTQYLPEFQGGKSDITIRNLMTHFSGFRPDFDLEPSWSGYESGIHLALVDTPVAPPGTRFIYSDINYVLLGEIVHRLSGETLADFASKEVFSKIGMSDTMFRPPARLIARIAPTEIDPASGAPLRGVVHDPRSRLMGGIAGHAGLFITADDLARFAQMMLDGGKAGSVRVFDAQTIRLFTSPQSPADQPILRGLGWDIDSPYSSPRGELFPVGSYGHTGFTGTSLWIDPDSRTYVILLTNAVHPHGGKSIVSLRSRVATIAAASLGIDVPRVAVTGYNETITGPGLHRVVAPDKHVLTGLDVLAQQNFAPLQGKRIGLITNHTGLSRDGKRNVDLMLAAGVKVAALFSPEHGIAGKKDQPDVADSKDAQSGLRVISLFQGSKQRLTPGMLKDVDTVVFDIQDVGARFYTYSCTMLWSMETAAQQHVPFIVLDRPNPITGVHVEGPMIDPANESFVGCYEMPLRHGLTFGELATMYNAEHHVGADLRVIQMTGWQRGDWFDATGQIWVNPSPNMRSLNAALLYPGIAMLEYSPNYSVGRGTDSPFEQIGADWINGPQLASLLNSRYIPGVRVYATRFPRTDNSATKWIEGVRFVITDRDAFDSTRLGLEVGHALEQLYPGKIPWQVNARLIGDQKVIAAEKSGTDPRAIIDSMHDAVQTFAEKRKKYLLY